VARVALLSRDLLFASRLQAELAGAGIDVELTASLDRVAELGAGDLVVVDLASGDFDAATVASSLAAPAPSTLAYYSHVDGAVRQAALAAGIERVVPRSRLAREGLTLVRSALADAG